MKTRPRKLVAIVAVITAAMVLAGTATAQATTGTLDYEEQGATADTVQTTTSAEAGAEDQDPVATPNLIKQPVCDVFCEPDPCFLDPICDPDPCDLTGCSPVPVPYPGPPDPPEEPAPPCTTRTWEWAATVGTLNGHVMARPTALFQYCVASDGNVQNASFIGFQSNSLYPGLVAEPPIPTINRFSDLGRTAFRVSFPLTFRFAQKTTIQAGIGPASVTVTFEVDESCSLSVAFTLGSGDPTQTDNTTNPCREWRPRLV